MLFKLSKSIATLGPIGYLTAPGTWASTITLGIVYAAHVLHVSSLMYALFTFSSCIVAWYAVVYSLDYFRSSDPSEIVIDECVGCLVTFSGVPCTMATLMVGFLLFRFFDIKKPFGLKKLEGMGGAWGILLDDIGAGILSNLILQILLFFNLL